MKIRPSGTTLLAALLLVTTGGTAGFLLRPAEPPSDLEAATELDSAPVVAEAFTDERNVRVALNFSPTLDLVLGRGGTVTASECVPDGALESGEVLARVNDEPVVGLATSMPLYRDLAQGHRGADVRALQKELERLGLLSSVDGVYGWGTAQAVRQLFRDAGVRHPDGRLSREDVVWMPSAEVAVDDCAVLPGSSVSSGGAFAEVSGTLESARVESMPDSPLSGDRLLTVAGVTGPVDEDGFVDDEEFLRELADTSAARSAQQGEEDPVNGSLELSEPVDAFSVPPGALIGTAEGEGCLEAGGSLYAVRVVGSSLGGAVVVPVEDGGLPIDAVHLFDALYGSVLLAFSRLIGWIDHQGEHYGKLVTAYRVNGIVFSTPNAAAIPTRLINFHPSIRPIGGRAKPEWELNTATKERRCWLECHTPSGAPGGARMEGFGYRPPSGDLP